MDEFDKLIEKLRNDLLASIPAIVDEMKEIEREVIEEVVYNQYEPREYQRRMDEGGLTDKDNMQEVIVNKSNGVDIIVTNITRGNSAYSGAEGYTKGCISDIIEEGNGYGYDLDSYIGARPFNETAQNIINYTDRIDNIIERELKKKGW